MVVFLFRPSPQVPEPSVRAASLCYEASAHNIKFQHAHIDNPAVDATWVFLQSLFMAVNTILWAISYPEVRNVHPREEVDKYLQLALHIMTRCSERWPGSTGATQLYSTLSQACLRSYSIADHNSSIPADSPASLADTTSPNSEHSSATTTSITYSQKAAEPPQFGFVFDQAPDQFSSHDWSNYSLAPPAQPLFRSGSIFVSPSHRQADRRFSYFPPEFPQHLPSAWESTPAPALNPQLTAPPPASSTTTASRLEPNYFMNPMYNFGPQLYAEQNDQAPQRNGSLSQQQQRELMDDLEMNGVSGISDYLGIPLQYYGTTDG